MPGAPFGLPGLGFPAPYPPLEPLDAYLEPCPDEPAELPLEPEPPDELNFGAGALFDVPLEEPTPPVVEPWGLYVVPTGAFVGATGILNGLFGAFVIFGALGALILFGLYVGFIVGLAVGALIGVGF